MTTGILVGSVGSGKTTLSQRLRACALTSSKTQTIVWEDNLLDTPGEYVDHRFFQNALLMAAFDADVVLMLAAASGEDSRLPPAFAARFNRPVIGVVTKTDIASPNQLSTARTRLTIAGAHDLMEVSAVNNWGIESLRDRIMKLTRSAA